MILNPNIHYRKSIRLNEYDYGSAGEYFVTICTYERECLLGTVVGENIILSEIGKIAKEGWKEIPTHFPNVTLEEFVIMPNHVHGIIVINACRDLINQIPTKGKYPLMKNPSLTLGKIIRHYKERTTKLARNSGCTGFRWQGGYYDRIIRNDKELRNIRKYIANNPIRWFFDKENPDYAESKI